MTQSQPTTKTASVVNYYELLRVKPNSPKDAIKEALRKAESSLFAINTISHERAAEKRTWLKEARKVFGSDASRYEYNEILVKNGVISRAELKKEDAEEREGKAGIQFAAETETVSDYVSKKEKDSEFKGWTGEVITRTLTQEESDVLAFNERVSKTEVGRLMIHLVNQGVLNQIARAEENREGSVTMINGLPYRRVTYTTILTEGAKIGLPPRLEAGIINFSTIEIRSEGREGRLAA